MFAAEMAVSWRITAWNGAGGRALVREQSGTQRRAGRYSLWCRANGSPFRWRWGGGAWKATGDDWRDEVVVQQHAAGPIVAHWQLLGEVEAHAGKETLAVSLAGGDTEVAIDCFLLTRHPFAPRGPRKP